MQVLGKHAQGNGGLLGDNAVPEEAEEVHAELPSAASTSHRQPISHATNAGLRESRGKLGEAGEDVPPGVGIVGARRPERQASTACSFNGRLFLSAVSGEASALFQSLLWAVAQSTLALGSIRSPPLPRWFGPPFVPSLALGVGQADAQAGRRTAASVSVSDLYGPSRAASDAPLAFESMAVAVGQKEDTGP